MAGDDEEYKMGSLDEVSNEFTSEGPSPTDSNPASGGGNGNASPPIPEVQRKALFIVGTLLAIFIVYKIFGLFFGGKPTEPPPKVPVAQIESPAPMPVPQTNEVTNQLNAAMVAQQNMRSDIDNLNNQLSGLQSGNDALTAKVNALETTLQALASKIDADSNNIALLLQRTEPKPVIEPIQVRVKHHYRKRHIYHIQAVVPGRAWLIANDGSTLTVRPGSKLRGYGIVTGVNANKGIVSTSAGITIRFSQEDS